MCVRQYVYVTCIVATACRVYTWCSQPTGTSGVGNGYGSRGCGICSDGDVNAAVTCMCLYWSVCVMCMYGLVGCECVRDCDKGAHDGGA